MLAARRQESLPDADRGQARPHAGHRVRCVVLRHPFEGCNEVAEVIRAVMSGERPGATPDDPMCPPALRALIDACWSKEPHNRPTMEAVHDAVAAIPKIDRRSGMLSSPLP